MLSCFQPALQNTGPQKGITRWLIRLEARALWWASSNNDKGNLQRWAVWHAEMVLVKVTSVQDRHCETKGLFEDGSGFEKQNLEPSNANNHSSVHVNVYLVSIVCLPERMHSYVCVCVCVCCMHYIHHMHWQCIIACRMSCNLCIVSMA